MKKSLIIFLVFLFLGTGLWATPLVYDEIRYESRYSYSIGARASLMFGQFGMDAFHDVGGGNPPFRRDINFDYDSINFGLFYQAEWRYFIFGIAPTYYIQSVFPIDSGDNLYVYGKNGNLIPLPPHKTESRGMVGVDLQLLLKFPILHGAIPFFLFLGPEASISDNIDMHILGGFDLGFALTTHHVFFFNWGGGMNITGTSGGPGKIMTDTYGLSKDNFWTRGPGVKFEFSIGIRTRRIEEVFYYQGQEIDRRR